MQDRWKVRMTVVSLLLILCLIVTAGCTDIPGPEPRKATPTPTPTPDLIPMKTMRVTTTLVTVVPTVPAPERTAPPARPAVTQAPGTYELRTCAQMGGVIVNPGERCPGTWLPAPDTFSCCSEPAVTVIDRNASITVDPFDLEIRLDDDPGRILP